MPPGILIAVWIVIPYYMLVIEEQSRECAAHDTIPSLCSIRRTCTHLRDRQGPCCNDKDLLNVITLKNDSPLECILSPSPVNIWSGTHLMFWVGYYSWPRCLSGIFFFSCYRLYFSNRNWLKFETVSLDFGHQKLHCSVEMFVVVQLHLRNSYESILFALRRGELYIRSSVHIRLGFSSTILNCHDVMIRV